MAVSLQIHAAAAIHRNDLARDIRRIGDQEQHRSGNVVWFTRALEQRLADDVHLSTMLMPPTISLTAAPLVPTLFSSLPPVSQAGSHVF